MAVRESFLTVSQQQALAPGPAHYTHYHEDHVKGGDSLKSKVILFSLCCVHVCTVCMYSCMYSCMYACMYECMHVCVKSIHSIFLMKLDPLFSL